MMNSDISPAGYVATIGFFDGVHRGHRFLIDRVRQVAARAGMKSLAVTFDRHPREVLQASYVPQLLTTPERKVQLLRQTGVDRVAVLPFTRALAALTARQFMQRQLRDALGVRKLVIGYDHRFGHNRAETFADYVRYGQELGMEVLHNDAFVLDGMRVSSSLVRRLLAGGQVAEAARCLGYCYTLEGRVAHGYAEGRRMGFPTANLDVGRSHLLVPARGVYAVRAGFGTEPCTRPAMLNIGHRPTFGGTQTTIEAHLFGFCADVYGQPMRVAFVQRLRDERRFAAVEELERQLQADRQEALRLLGLDPAAPSPSADPA